MNLLGTIALVAASWFAVRTPMGDCDVYCPPGEGEGSSGSVPSGVTCQMIFLPPTPGEGSDTCATCTPCQSIGALNFNGNGTGWCIRVTTGGLSSSNPLPVYNRPGKLLANCDAALDCVTIAIIDCSGSGSPAYTQTNCLACGCNA